MAKPIKVTPVLTGKDAANFLRSIKENKDKRASKDFILEMRQAAKRFNSILKTR